LELTDEDYDYFMTTTAKRLHVQQRRQRQWFDRRGSIIHTTSLTSFVAPPELGRILLRRRHTLHDAEHGLRPGGFNIRVERHLPRTILTNQE
jgi:hypothetical protein